MPKPRSIKPRSSPALAQSRFWSFCGWANEGDCEVAVYRQQGTTNYIALGVRQHKCTGIACHSCSGTFGPLHLLIRPMTPAELAEKAKINSPAAFDPEEMAPAPWLTFGGD